VISLLAFGLEALTPGDPAYLLLQAAGRQTITAEDLAAKRAELHLDDPLPVRYVTWLGGAVRGDFGRSFRSYAPVAQLYVDRIGGRGAVVVDDRIAHASGPSRRARHSEPGVRRRGAGKRARARDGRATACATQRDGARGHAAWPRGSEPDDGSRGGRVCLRL